MNKSSKNIEGISPKKYINRFRNSFLDFHEQVLIKGDFGPFFKIIIEINFLFLIPNEDVFHVENNQKIIYNHNGISSPLKGMVNVFIFQGFFSKICNKFSNDFIESLKELRLNSEVF
jgi:hypothetical protein